MINAQTMMETDTLIALMIMAAMVGYLLDKILLFVNRRIVTWKYAA
jgi:ABC-type nitrate/sulfonate/bicarbonate transport system permease component